MYRIYIVYLSCIYRVSIVYLSCMYRVCIVYVSCMYRDYQRNYGCKGSKNNWYMQIGGAEYVIFL